ncbi:MAG: hypothetical protein ACI9LV_000930 [Candidatus Nanohaloarchaea archaeon]|jgi:hypothetical protein
MDYSINPEKHELEAVRRLIEGVVEKYSYSLEVEKIEFDLGWERFEKDCNVIASSNKVLNITVNPEKDLENLEKRLLRGILELEFMEKAEYNDIRYHWQEIAKMAYVKIRSSNLRDIDLAVEDELEARWAELKPKLENESEEFNEELYLNAGLLAESIGKVYQEQDRLDDLPEAKRDDIIKTGDNLFN